MQTPLTLRRWQRAEYDRLVDLGCGIGTVLLLLAALVIAGTVAYRVLPVSPLPQVDFPTISVSASLPGASADISSAFVSLG